MLIDTANTTLPIKLKYLIRHTHTINIVINKKFIILPDSPNNKKTKYPNHLEMTSLIFILY